MEIILMEDVRRLGKRGETVDVKPGFARNYLLPKGAALTANKANRALFDQQRKKIDARHAKKRDAALEVAAALAGVNVTIAKRVGESETLYGSVTTGEIVEFLERKGVTIDKRRLDFGSPHGIKALGEYTVTVDLHPEVKAEIVVSVVPEEA
ncbi:MAG: 50S ribosomal protein L9 [Thermoanaerobaculia bacterium]